MPETLLQGRNGTLFYVLAQIALRYALVVALAAVLCIPVAQGSWVTMLQVLGAGHLFLAFALSLIIHWVRKAQSAENKARLTGINETQEQIEELFAMTDTLQSADSNADAAQVLRAPSRKLLPGCGVALYVFNNSRDRLDLIDSWDMPEAYVASDSLVPSNCWALKRGKDHFNNPQE